VIAETSKCYPDWTDSGNSTTEEMSHMASAEQTSRTYKLSYRRGHSRWTTQMQSHAIDESLDRQQHQRTRRLQTPRNTCPALCCQRRPSSQSRTPCSLSHEPRVCWSPAAEECTAQCSTIILC